VVGSVRKRREEKKSSSCSALEETTETANYHLPSAHAPVIIDVVNIIKHEKTIPAFNFGCPSFFSMLQDLKENPYQYSIHVTTDDP
jgi:hypothetical protein